MPPSLLANAALSALALKLASIKFASSNRLVRLALLAFPENGLNL